MKTKELKDQVKGLSVEELVARLADAEKNLENLKFAHAVSPIENPLQIRTERRTIALLKTELHAKVTEIVKEQLKAENVTLETAREFLAKNSFAAPVNLAMVKKLISQIN
ncbi:50S ribosomal protein L29 [Sediminitomix flava]|uniref:Large ribosomal subunit protein uL29 n=1 Tax=Sediminitomix flava TaxID=379075 RepID=A0A315Z837_SEDFL|nr:50S ribosomal protein L29 [Sediminitomix flava]PWJ39350.1 ribosomal protein L29 [Sediminitomix flava]